MKNVLFIEPDKTLRQAYQSFFADKDIDVRLAHSAETAIAMCDAKTPDVIVLEVLLGGHGGIEFLYELRSYQEWTQVPVILYTLLPQSAFEDFTDALRLLHVSHHAYKPTTSLKKLSSMVQNELIGLS